MGTGEADDGAGRRDGWNTGTPNSDGAGNGPSKLVRVDGEALVSVIKGDDATAWTTADGCVGDCTGEEDEDTGVMRTGAGVANSSLDLDTSIESSREEAADAASTTRGSSGCCTACSDNAAASKSTAGTARSDEAE